MKDIAWYAALGVLTVETVFIAYAIWGRNNELKKLQDELEEENEKMLKEELEEEKNE